MAFGKKMQEVFDRYIAAIDRMGSKFDFIKMSPRLEDRLKLEGIRMNPAQYIAEIFDELEYPRGNWKVNYEDLKKFFGVLPDRIKKERITQEILENHVPRNEWGLYDKKLAASLEESSVNQSKAKVQAAYLESIGAFEQKPVILSERLKKGEYIVQIFLGDVSKVVGSYEDSNYPKLYDSLEEEIGRGVALAAFKEAFQNDVAVTVEDWPNLTCLVDAAYEIKLKSDRPLLQNTIKKAAVRAMELLGLA